MLLPVLAPQFLAELRVAPADEFVGSLAAQLGESVEDHLPRHRVAVLRGHSHRVARLHALSHILERELRRHFPDRPQLFRVHPFEPPEDGLVQPPALFLFHFIVLSMELFTPHMMP